MQVIRHYWEIWDAEFNLFSGKCWLIKSILLSSAFNLSHSLSLCCSNNNDDDRSLQDIEIWASATFARTSCDDYKIVGKNGNFSHWNQGVILLDVDTSFTSLYNNYEIVYVPHLHIKKMVVMWSTCKHSSLFTMQIAHKIL